MRSESGSFCFCLTLALWAVVLVLIEDSHALQCYACGSKDTDCNLKECKGSDPEVCRADYLSDGTRKKSCLAKEIAENVGGGVGNCKENLKSNEPTRYLIKKDYEDKKLSNPMDPEIQNKTADEYADEKLGSGGGKGITMKMCTCDAESCNDEGFDKKNNPKGSSSSSSGSGSGSGKLFAVAVGGMTMIVFLAIAPLAANVLVPGFLRS